MKKKNYEEIIRGWTRRQCQAACREIGKMPWYQVHATQHTIRRMWDAGELPPPVIKEACRLVVASEARQSERELDRLAKKQA